MNNIVEKIRNNKELKGEYKVENTPVKVIGIGGAALKVLVFESSKFTSKPIWKQHWINFKDDSEKEFTRKLIMRCLDCISFSLPNPCPPTPLTHTYIGEMWSQSYSTTKIPVPHRTQGLISAAIIFLMFSLLRIENNFLELVIDIYFT